MRLGRRGVSQRSGEPRARELPIALRRGGRDLEGRGHLGDFEPAEETKLDDAGPSRLGRGELIQGVVENEKIDDPLVLRGERLVECDLKISTALGRIAGASVIDEDAPHRLGHGAEEMRAIAEWDVGAGEPEKGLVDESRRLERVTLPLAAHVPARDRVQLTVDERQQLGERCGVAAACRGEKIGDRVAGPAIRWNGSTPARRGDSARRITRAAPRGSPICIRVFTHAMPRPG